MLGYEEGEKRQPQVVGALYFLRMELYLQSLRKISIKLKPEKESVNHGCQGDNDRESDHELKVFSYPDNESWIHLLMEMGC